MSLTDKSNFRADSHRRLYAQFHGPLLKFFLRRLKNRSDAEDCTQEVLLRALRTPTLDQVNRADAFVFTIAVNLLRDRQRKESRQGVTWLHRLDGADTSALANELVESFTPERVLLGRDSLTDVLRTLGNLGEPTRSIFILFRLENMKQKDIAVLFGIGQKTVEKHVMKAALHLAAKYGERQPAHE